MSRWTTQAGTPSLIEAWDLLKAGLSQAAVDDKTVVTSVEELARLKKVAAYLRSIYDSIEPDFVPLVTWTQVEEQLRACTGQVVAYNASRSISNIVQANAHADALLGLIRPFMLTRDRAARALRAAVEEYQTVLTDQVRQQVEFFESARGQAAMHVDAVAKAEAAAVAGRNDILQASKAIHGSEKEGEPGYLGGIKKAAEQIEKIREEAATYHDELIVGDEESPSIKVIVREAASGARKSRDEVVALRDAFSKQLDELRALHARVFGTADADGKAVGGLKDELEAHKARLEQQEKNESARIKALGDEIESLLPGAASASLATAYREMSQSFDEPIRRADSLFRVSIALLFLTSLALSIHQIGWLYVHFQPWPQGLDGLFATLIPKLPFYVPLVWLAYFASARRSEAQRLKQEYAHKQALTSSYQSFKKQIAALEETDEALLRDLMRKAIETVSRNASETLDKRHGDRHPMHEALDAVSKARRDAASNGESDN